MKNIFYLVFLFLIISCVEDSETTDSFSTKKENNVSGEETNKPIVPTPPKAEENKVNDTINDESSSLPEKIQTNLNDYKVIECSNGDTKLTRCMISGDKSQRIVDYIISDESSVECFEKRNLKVRYLSRSIISRGGCNSKVYIKVGNIRSTSFNSENIETSTQVKVFTFGDITLPNKIKKGEFVDINPSNNENVFYKTNDGFGILGGDVATGQFNHDSTTNEFEAFVFNIRNEIKVRVTLSRLFAKEGERALAITLNENNEILRKKYITLRKDNDLRENKHEKSFSIITKGAKSLLILPYKYRKGFIKENDSSDFYIKELETFSAEDTRNDEA